jgi:uncharacterized protein (DUF983 family)
MNDKKAPHGYLFTVLDMNCPRCREGKIFKNKLSLKLSRNLDMNPACPVCNQPTEVEVGFYVGTGYVSYALTVALTGVTFVLWLVTIGFSLDDNRIFWWLGSNAVFLILLQPLLMRISRSLWLSWFVKYDQHWNNNQEFNKERIIAEQMEGKQDIRKAIIEKT